MNIPFLITLLLLFIALVLLGIMYRRVQEFRTRLEQASLRVMNNQRFEAQARQLAVQQAAMQALGEVAFESLMLIDSDHQVVALNAAARDLFNLAPDWRGGADTVISVTRQHELDDLIAATLENSDEPLTHQIMLQARPYRVRSLCIDSEVGSYVALALEDVSELQRLGRARRDMVANISHELRTPITSIRLLVDTLLRGAINDAAKSIPLAEKIAVEVGTLEQMAQELLDLAMIESGRAEFKLIPVSMRAVADDAMSRLAALAERSHVTVESSIDPSLMVLADGEQVARVLTNLLHNAIKFTPAGGRIDIAALPEGEMCTITVTDTGTGIPVLDRGRIFERFYRGDRARHSSGTGLGLAIAKHIIEAHGGRIWADEPPLRPDFPSGAQLCFTLPTT